LFQPQVRDSVWKCHKDSRKHHIDRRLLTSDITYSWEVTVATHSHVQNKNTCIVHKYVGFDISTLHYPSTSLYLIIQHSWEILEHMPAILGSNFNLLSILSNFLLH
jgi:hypothetical protein